MTSFRQFEANRRNALRSTGPKTNEGKQRSRLNAVRHGLTAETVIGALEDAEDYKSFSLLFELSNGIKGAVVRTPCTAVVSVNFAAVCVSFGCGSIPPEVLFVG